MGRKSKEKTPYNWRGGVGIIEKGKESDKSGKN